METKPQRLKATTKFEERAKRWKFPEGTPFANAGVQESYQRRVQMLIDVITLTKPERVPVCPAMGIFPFVYAGVTPQEAMYDYTKLAEAVRRYHSDFMPDTMAGTAIYGSGKILELLDYKLYRWPGHGVPPTESYQCIEDEYMRADEFDSLINDPSDFFLRNYLPRVFGRMAPLAMLGPLTDILELPSVGLAMIPFGLSQVQEALRMLLEAGQAASEWIQACMIDTYKEYGVYR